MKYKLGYLIEDGTVDYIYEIEKYSYRLVTANRGDYNLRFRLYEANSFLYSDIFII